MENKQASLLVVLLKGLVGTLKLARYSVMMVFSS